MSFSSIITQHYWKEIISMLWTPTSSGVLGGSKEFHAIYRIRRPSLPLSPGSPGFVVDTTTLEHIVLWEHSFQDRSQNCEQRLLASLCLSVCLSVRMEKFGSHWTVCPSWLTDYAYTIPSYTASLKLSSPVIHSVFCLTTGPKPPPKRFLPPHSAI